MHSSSQCWPRSMSSYGATRPQWVKVSELLCQYTSITQFIFILITWYRGGAFYPSDASLSYAHVEITKWCIWVHYSDVTMRLMTSSINIVSSICSTICFGGHQRKHQKSASLVFMRGIHRWPVDSPHKGPITRKMFRFDDVLVKHMYVNKEDLHHTVSL